MNAKRLADSTTLAVRCKHLDAQPEEDYLGPRGRLSYLQAADGHRMCCYFWPAAEPKAVVILVHGQGSYLTFEYLRFTGVGKPKLLSGSWVDGLNKAGYSVCGIDNRGCGRSAGLHGYVDSHQHWIDDVVALTRHVQSRESDGVPAGFCGLPTFLLGTSLGGCIALLSGLQQPELFQGLLLMAPMISLEKIKSRGLNPILLRLAALLNLVVPTWPLCKTARNDMFPDLQEDFDADPATYHFDTRIRVGVECIAACDAAMSRMGALSLPLLVAHSLKDDMTDPEGSKLLVKQAQSSDKTLRLLTDMWHVLTKEEGNLELLAANIAWLDQRVGGAGLKN